MTHAATNPARVIVATPLESELIARVRAIAPDTVFAPELVPAARYPGDHRGEPTFVRDALATERWHRVLAGAEIAFGIPGESPEGLRELLAHGPRLRWVQSMFAGGGETVRAAGVGAEVLRRVAFTTTAGVHGTMLAEFAFYGLLALRKSARRLERMRADRQWQRFVMGELAGSTLAIAGTGNIGVAVARIARAFGMHVIGITRSSKPREEFDELAPVEALADVCARCDALVLALPGTVATQHFLDAKAIAALRSEAIVVNIGRGTTLDQVALTRALSEGRIAGAVLDVFDPEPLPPNDPLWSLENVIFSPHTATLSQHENARIVDLFIDNLRRDAAGEQLRNRVDVREFY